MFQRKPTAEEQVDCEFPVLILGATLSWAASWLGQASPGALGSPPHVVLSMSWATGEQGLLQAGICPPLLQFPRLRPTGTPSSGHLRTRGLDVVAMSRQGPRHLAHPCPCKCRASREGINCFPGECVRDTVTSSGYEQQVPWNLFQVLPCPCTWSCSASLVFVTWRGMGVVPETLDLSVSDPWVPASTHLQVPDVEGLLEDVGSVCASRQSPHVGQVATEAPHGLNDEHAPLGPAG